ncbi:MAG: PcfK-like family protein [Tannerellaceae bacterium]|nr:PcfK-like family protein [Tannerellaceae bacterium]
MKATDGFKAAIKKYLDDRAATDELFATTYAKPGKDINDCITHILNTVKESGCNGFADEEIYSMAVHYYDEDKVDIGKPIGGKVVVNHVVELTAEEKREARQAAIRKYQSEVYTEIKKKPVTRKKTSNNVQQPTLFG